MSPEDNGSHHGGFFVAVDLEDVVFQHNTVLMSDQSTCWNSVFFNMKDGWHWPPPRSVTHNLWILDNVLCRRPDRRLGGAGHRRTGQLHGGPTPAQ